MNEAFFAIRERSCPKFNRLKKFLRRFLKNFFNLDILFDVNSRVINFLDVDLNLDPGLYSPF